MTQAMAVMALGLWVMTLIRVLAHSAEALNDPAHAVLLDRDLHRRGSRSGPDLTHKRAHTSAPYGLLTLRAPSLR